MKSFLSSLVLLFAFSAITASPNTELATSQVIQSYDFTVCQDGWTTGKGNLMPKTTFRWEPGRLCLGPSSIYTFGYWLSPINDTLQSPPNDLYCYVAWASTNISDKLPVIRARINSTNQSQATVLNINPNNHLSTLSSTPSKYRVFYKPQHEGLLANHFLGYDFLSATPFENTDKGSLYLDHAALIKVNETTKTLVARYTFETDDEGWLSAGAEPVFIDPVFKYTGSGLMMMATSTFNCYGTWQTPTGSINVDPGYIYVSEITVNQQRLPGNGASHFRIRYLLDNLDSSSTEDWGIWSSGTRSYESYYYPPQVYEDPVTMIVALDFIGIDFLSPSGTTIELLEWNLYKTPFPENQVP